ncbi:calcium/sodium antiporter [Occultella aeris]|uniref:Inner membrane protein YrbG n=1 Tax=Occultella aeris TaxID=2761496 RepID=A0A7M4DKX1_9MICO|nr:calcium/sodium antiporter [Occultella aeris]VZO37855.1 Inner membrane protein YrbG [Occultella aeris]
MPAPIAILLGLLALIGGAELLVRGGSNLAARLGISPIVVGLTVVSLGTSMPELAIGLQAATSGSAGLAIGNIVGTNIVNLLLILGLSALIRPIALETRTVRTDLPAMLVASVLLVLMALDGVLSLWEGVLLVGAGLAYTLLIVHTAKRESAAVKHEYDEEYEVPERTRTGRRGLVDLLLLVGGIAIIVFGSDLLVGGAVEIATDLGVSEAVIGLTIIAIGTSAPELVTTIVSTIKGDRDIALGNLLGSSVYNIVFILGATMIASPAAIAVPAEVLRVDLVLMFAVAIACVPVFMSGRKINRIEGAIFVGAYVAYLTYLIVART